MVLAPRSLNKRTTLPDGPADPDLATAYAVATRLAELGERLVAAADADMRAVPGLVTDLVLALADREAVSRVVPALVRASEPGSRFGRACAHHAAVHHAERLVRSAWRGADPDRNDDDTDLSAAVAAVAGNPAGACRAVAAGVWPDFGRLRVAVQVEALRAVPAAPGRRLRFDDASRSVWLDGDPVGAGLDPDHYRFLRAVAAGPGWVAGRELDAALNAGGEKKWKRDVVARLPARLRALVGSRPGGGGGYCLTLPPLPVAAIVPGGP